MSTGEPTVCHSHFSGQVILISTVALHYCMSVGSRNLHRGRSREGGGSGGSGELPLSAETLNSYSI